MERGDARNGMVRQGGSLPAAHILPTAWVDVQWRAGDFDLTSPEAARRANGQSWQAGQPPRAGPHPGLALRTKVTPNGKSVSLCGPSTFVLFDRKPNLEDWATLFQWLAEVKIELVIAARFPILEAGQANALLECGHVIGNVALVSPDRARQ